MIEYTATATVSAEQISNQVVSAVEGGISYWCSDFGLETPARESLLVKPWYSDQKLYEEDFRVRFTQEEEHTKDSGRDVFLTPEAIKSGLKVLSEKYPSTLADILLDEGDADTADTFIQCCLFGDLVYG